MTGTGLPNFDHAVQTANTWLIDVAKATGNEEDRHRAYRLLRAWLHTLRDRLPTDVAAHLGAQLPTLVRGVYYEGWDPHPTPVKFDRQEYLDRFGHEASLAAEDAEDAARAVTGAVFLHIPPEQLAHVFDALPHDLRPLITPAV
ncbi:DUF2267 domain-containing protein [Kitasatospora sp. NPDC001159]